jgi:hypothetical protein
MGGMPQNKNIRNVLTQASTAGESFQKKMNSIWTQKFERPNKFVQPTSLTLGG